MSGRTIFFLVQPPYYKLAAWVGTSTRKRILEILRSRYLILVLISMFNNIERSGIDPSRMNPYDLGDVARLKEFFDKKRALEKEKSRPKTDPQNVNPYDLNQIAEFIRPTGR
jgi:hypothetical protein